jgi:hypothetical protein
MEFATLKRLEVIKTLIILEDIENIDVHIKKLKSSKPNEHVASIIKCLETNAYGDAAALIEEIIIKSNQLTEYIDPAVQGLKIELKVLEDKLSVLINEKAEIAKLIHDFNHRYQQSLGELIGELLKLKREKLKTEAQEHPEKQTEYEEIKKDYERFEQTYKETKDYKLFELSDSEQNKLKKHYRRASKLCHPDVVAEELKKEAAEIFNKLNKAYEQNDLYTVRDILKRLEQGEMLLPASDSLSDKKRLKSKIAEMREQLSAIIKEIDMLKQDDTYQTILTIKDWDDYFAKIKNQLESAIETYKMD